MSDRATMPSISNTDLAKLVIRLPPIDEQLGMSESLSGVSEQLDLLGDIYRRRLAALDELKQSLLHHAFTGQL